MLLLELKKTNQTLGTIHFIGIGGVGMSGIAEILHNLGYKVQGSDLVENYNTKRLESYGIKIFLGHAKQNIKNVSYVVISSAIHQNNPEIKEALERKIPIIRRAEMLAELMRLKCSVAVSGSHGKTTTTSLIACLFEAAGLYPTVINGGIINNKSTNAYLGSSNYLIAEADESDATFIHIPSTIAIITNIDPEHLDYYQDFEILIGAFRSFITNLPFYGFAVCCIDHKIVRKLVDDITERKIITYGIDAEDAHIIAFNINTDIASSTFDVKISLPNVLGTTIIEKITIPTPGRHNILNSLAAIAVGIELDFGIKAIKNGFNNFKGVKRRFTKVAEYNQAVIIDDYAHHPEEIKATLATAKNIANQQNGKVIAIFQPHRYSRIKYLFDDFMLCFADADILYITNIYAAGEKPIEGITGQSLVDKMTQNKYHDKANFLAELDDVVSVIIDHAASGDMIIMMGAGNISSFANELDRRLLSQEILASSQNTDFDTSSYDKVIR
ncbi:UDP-N-acetylmuramate--L-alanine ligase [Rickettsia typhi]|uniref:UDP-N-acetylmuramate--L-alanine ligase n=2 Tax=Rickettsia typhi TaxID=785 RepID=MURC_RICTY|nr:UDP-N-acetylmuramate--L-alanine ligase [Rickettsia typhi]Q68XC2.1 RecName: Full=UDP-N-acetylmuramate--L-alanine ligase; AltName: Full=UDP-N-acetylmuramoyl-L-alanine synthetase [Rickettsia typhi str. Wilmington]AAU03720.1 UDP-N-acetylmuramate--L-alanine ligase [Rickettsia typhi str. Wilmington]AFE54097.1 UDP-N-acetylmuramate--L-alanine ligase [Rickettsia typhi str. TH1527]AFE54936.1 UDP-N-acetylmuramate--L-alanine ligase [Rickettsia typhi str. B9991CWPP]